MSQHPATANDPLHELETLVQDLRETDNQQDFFNHLSAINQKIDLIKEAVERLCETTSGCLESTNGNKSIKNQKLD
jgi:hypothetical protein